MRSATHLTLLNLFLPLLVSAQTIIESPRYTSQQRYIRQEFLSGQLPGANTTDLADTLLRQLEEGWKKHAAEPANSQSAFPAGSQARLDPYIYQWILLTVNKQNQLEKALEFHVYKNYMLPSLQKDFFAVRSNPALINQGLIWENSLRNTLVIGLKNYNDKASMTLLYDIAFGLRTLIYTVDNASTTNAGKLLEIINGYESELEAKNFYAKDNASGALTYLLSSLTSGRFPKSQAIEFSRSLINYYNVRSENDKSIVILNNLALTTTPSELSRDSLKSWYLATDKIQGPRWFASMSGKAPAAGSFAVSAKPAASLPSDWNLISGSPAAGKIGQASYLLLYFWNSANAPSASELASLNTLHNSIRNRHDVALLGINTDRDKNAALQAISRLKIGFPVAFSAGYQNLAEQLGISRYPARFILNKNGQQLSRGSAAIGTDGFAEFMQSLNR